MNARTWVFCAVAFVYVEALDNYEERHKYQIATQMGRLKEIPRRFEVKGENAIADLKRYINDIEKIVRKENVTLAFRMKVETLIPKQKYPKKNATKKIKTKKYNVPLKKKNMKLSNFELILRQHGNEHVLPNSYNYQAQPITTQKEQISVTMKPVSSGKYKPILSHVKTNYTKIVRPIRNKVITLFV